MDTGEPLAAIRANVQSANVYFGAWPVVDALAQGAEIVITGRVTDTGLALAPMIHEFGWKHDDWDRLSAGTIAGHSIECGAQSHRRKLPGGLGNHSAHGRHRLSDHRSRARRDFLPHQARRHRRPHHRRVGEGAVALRNGRSARLHHARLRRRFHHHSSGPGRSGSRALLRHPRPSRRPTSTKSPSVTRPDSKPSACWSTRGPMPTRKLAPRTRFCASGWTGWACASTPSAPNLSAPTPATASPPPNRRREVEPHLAEVVLRIGVRSENRAAVERFTKELAPLALNGPPVVTGLGGGRPRVEEIVAYWPALIPKSEVTPEVTVWPSES